MAEAALKHNRAYRRRVQSFENLVQAGLTAIAEHGYYDTTVEHITEAADVGKGTFYAHFSSKEDLVYHLVRQGFDQLIEAGRITAASVGTPAECLAALIRGQLRVLSRRRDLVILLHQVRGLLILHPNDRLHLRQEYRRYVRYLIEECRRVLGEASLGNGEAMDLACAIAGFVAGTLTFEVLIRGGQGRRAGLMGPINAFAAGVAEQYRLSPSTPRGKEPEEEPQRKTKERGQAGRRPPA